MRKTLGILYIFLSIGTFTARGQNDDHLSERSFSIQTNYSNAFNGLIIPLLYGIEKAKTHFYLGPTVFLALGDNPSSSSSFALTGLQGSVAHYFAKNHEKVNFSLQGDVVWQRRKEEGASTIFNAQTSSFDPFDFKKVNNHIQLYVGYGLRVSLKNNYFLTQSIGIGSVLTFSTTETTLDNTNDFFVDADWLLKFGLTKVINK